MKVLLTDYQSDDTALEQSLAEAAGLAFAAAQCRTAEEVIAAATGCGALIASYAPITAEVFEALPQLRLVSAIGVGVDHIDTAAAARQGAWVANVPDANANEVATHALAMALSMIRHVPFFDRAVRRGAWDYLATGPLRRPSGLSLGILGLGRIGRELARLAAPTFARVLGHDPWLPDAAWPADVMPRSLEDLLAESDVVSLHLPLLDGTRALLGAEALARMRPGSYLVNVARGGIVDLDALLAALDDGRLAGAALDVLPVEPPPPDHPILAHPRVLLNPHAAFYSLESEEEARRKAVANVVAWARDGRPVYVVVEGRA